MGLMNMLHKGIQREFLLFISPHAFDNWSDVYVVTLLHGGNGTASGFFSRETNILRLIHGDATQNLDVDPLFIAGSPPLIVVAPQGLAGKTDNDRGSWANGITFNEARLIEPDDVGFIVAATQAGVAIAQKRADQVLGSPGPPTRGRLLAGFSNGGRMAARTAELFPEEFDVVAIVAAGYAGWTHFKDKGIIPETQWRAPLPLIHIRGTNDDVIEPAGEISPESIADKVAVMPEAQAELYARWDEPPESEVEAWALNLGLTERTTVVGVAGYTGETIGTITQREWEDPLTFVRTVAYYELEGVGHTWRKGSDFETMRVIWRFFTNVLDGVPF